MKFSNDDKLMKGAFGVVQFLELGDKKCAIKGLQYAGNNQEDQNLLRIYK